HRALRRSELSFRGIGSVFALLVGTTEEGMRRSLLAVRVASLGISKRASRKGLKAEASSWISIPSHAASLGNALAGGLSLGRWRPVAALLHPAGGSDDELCVRFDPQLLL